MINREVVNTAFFSTKRMLISTRFKIILLIYILSIFRQYMSLIKKCSFYNLQYNYYDLPIMVLRNFHIVIYVFILLFIWLVSDMYKNSNYNLVLMSRLSTRTEWLISQIGAIFIVSVIKMFILNLIVLLINPAHFNFSNQWSSLALNLVNDLEKSQKFGYILSQEIITYFSPLTLLLSANLLIILSMFFIGVVVLCGSIIFKMNKGFVLAFFILIINVLVFQSDSESLEKYTIYYNAIVCYPSLLRVTENIHNTGRMLYWIGLSIFFIVITNYVLQRKDLIIEDASV